MTILGWMMSQTFIRGFCMGFFENLHREFENAVADMEKQDRERNRERYERKQAKARLRGQKRKKQQTLKNGLF